MAISYDELRSARWFAPDTLKGFGHRSRLRQMGYDPRTGKVNRSLRF